MSQDSVTGHLSIETVGNVKFTAVYGEMKYLTLINQITEHRDLIFERLSAKMVKSNNNFLRTEQQLIMAISVPKATLIQYS